MQNAWAKPPERPPANQDCMWKIQASNVMAWADGASNASGATASHRLPVWNLEFGDFSIFHFPKFPKNGSGWPWTGAWCHWPTQRRDIGPESRPFGVDECDVVPELFREHAIREIVKGWNRHRISSPPRAWVFPLSLFPQAKARPRPRAAWQTCPMEKVKRSSPGILSSGRVSGKNRGTRRIRRLSDTPYVKYIFAICHILSCQSTRFRTC